MSFRPRVEVTVSDADDGALLVQAPAVGLYGFAPKVGEVLVGGSKVGTLVNLGTRTDLVLPRGVTGRVAERLLVTRSNPVEFGTQLLRLVPVEADDIGAGVGEIGAASGHDLPEGTHAVVSPTHGMFYRRPRPDAANYVEPGDVVETGATLALVEVMKCFSAIAYGGATLPARAEIVEVRVEDGAEVSSDEVLFVVKPV